MKFISDLNLSGGKKEEFQRRIIPNSPIHRPDRRVVTTNSKGEVVLALPKKKTWKERLTLRRR